MPDRIDHAAVKAGENGEPDTFFVYAKPDVPMQWIKDQDVRVRTILRVQVVLGLLTLALAAGALYYAHDAAQSARLTAARVKVGK